MSLSDGEETTLGLDPLDDDSDGDGQDDHDEVTDDDGLNDGDEVDLGLDLLNADSDDDGVSDGLARIE